MTTIYSLKKIKEIINDGFQYNLTNEVLEKINQISLEVGSPSYIKTPVFPKKTTHDNKSNDYNKRHNKSKNRNKSTRTDLNWNDDKKFSVTKIKRAEGVNITISEIRLLLNKLTNKNYDDILEKLKSLLEKSDDTYSDEISKIIFDLASTNRFYSKNYAMLYSDLLKSYDSMNTAFTNSLNGFLDLFKTIKYVDPNKDYDGFCDVNKQNEQRRAMSTFFVNLKENNIIDESKLVEFLNSLLTLFHKYIYEDDRKNEVDELCENVFILFDYKLCYDSYDLINEMTIKDYIVFISKSKTSSFKSLTNKTKFKFMDLLGV